MSSKSAENTRTTSVRQNMTRAACTQSGSVMRFPTVTELGQQQKRDPWYSTRVARATNSNNFHPHLIKHARRRCLRETKTFFPPLACGNISSRFSSIFKSNSHTVRKHDVWQVCTDAHASTDVRSSLMFHGHMSQEVQTYHMRYKTPQMEMLKQGLSGESFGPK